MKRLRSLLLLVCCFSPLAQTSLSAQNLSEGQIKKLIKKGRKASRDLEYWKAKTYYDKATEAGTRDPQHWYEAGVVYFDSKVEREKSLYFFKEAINLSFTDTIPELLYYLGDAYHYIGEYEQAITHYNLFRKEINLKSARGPELNNQVIRKIEICNNGIDLRDKQTIKFVEITNLGENINTNSSDYSPVLNLEENIILFCSRRPLTTKKSIDGEYFEDIYFSTRDGDDWTQSKVVDKSSGYINKDINTGKSHEAPISLSPDGNTLYIYKLNNIWKSEKNKRGEWGIPKKMNRNVNIGETNHSIFITKDGKEMYIAAAGAKGSLGGRDIYVAKLNPDGTWGRPTNLGPKINTEFDEDAPFMSSDGKSFYFASTGHNTMGGYDIFKVERDSDGNWKDPINIGAPINSNGNDVFYVENAEGSIAYFSSQRPGSYGHLDLYEADFNCQNIPTTNINGYAIFAHNHLPANGIIKITDKASGEELGTYKIDPNTGKYNMVLPPDATYILELVVAQRQIELVRAHREEFHVPKQCESYNLFQQISLSNVKNDNGDIFAQEAKFENALFDIESVAKEEFEIETIQLNETYIDSTAGISGTLAHNGTINAKNVEVSLLNLNNEIIRITRTNINGEFAFEKLDPNEDYIVIFNEEDALRSYREAVGNDAEEETTVQGFVSSYGGSNTQGKPNTSVYIADDNNEIKNFVSTDENGYFELSNITFNTEEVSSINENTTISYNMDIPTEEVLFSAYLVNIDPNNSDVIYTEYIDMVDLKEILMQTPTIIAETKVDTPSTELLADNNDQTDPIVEDPVVEDPIVADPVVEDPVVGDPVVEDPVVEDPVVEDPVVEDPIVEDPVVEDPVVEDPVVEDPVVEDPVVEDPVVEDPVVEDPVVEDPVVEDPVVEDPVVEDPVVEDPVVEDPVVEDPVVEDPVVEDPVVEDPVVEDPVVEDPVVEDPVVEDPVVEDPVVEDPVVEDPVVEDPVVEDPVVEDPVVEAPVVEDPVVEDPVVEDPVVEDPVVEDPVVEDPVVEDPVVQDPANENPDFASAEFANLYFDFDEYFLRNKSKNVLENLYEYLKDHPNATVRLDGHADWIGTEEYNNTLSQVRTLVAYKYLIDRGISPDRLDNAWFGESKPAVSNTNPDGTDSPENRQLNRRVEIKLEIPEMAALYIQL